MAIDTAGGLGVPRLDRLAMETADLRRLFSQHDKSYRKFSSAWFRVGGTFNVRMAVHACEQASVHGVLEGLRIDMQTHWFAADVVGQSGVTVARKAIVRRRLRWSFFAPACAFRLRKRKRAIPDATCFRNVCANMLYPHRSFPLQPVDCTASSPYLAIPPIRMTNSLISVSFNFSP